MICVFHHKLPIVIDGGIKRENNAKERLQEAYKSVFGCILIVGRERQFLFNKII